ncbi:MAG: 30S ribosomal protein S5 [Dehalococcoidia bacterium]
MKPVTKERVKKPKIDASDLTLEEKLLGIDRVTKVVKGGRHLRFRASVVVGDGHGNVGFGTAKAAAVPEAIRKAGAMAKKEMIKVPVKDGTIPHEIVAKFGASRILLKPAAPGTGLIINNTSRALLELAGVRDILGKSFGGPSKINVAKATMLALSNLRQSEEEAIQVDSEDQEAAVDETE